MACCAGIFTCIFNRHSEQFKDFSTSVISLFGAFLNTFNCYGFDRNYQAAGSIILLVYVCIASVLFINLLIAIISNGFQEINKIIE
jgi:Na+/H+-dicarboxylate symporter